MTETNTSSPVAQENSDESTLTQKLEEFRASFSSKVDGDTRDQMAQAIKELASTNITDSALKAGDTMPDFTLPHVSGDKSFQLNEALDQGPIALIYYRGDWCPYCNMQLAEYQRLLKASSIASTQIVAISPQTAENSKYATEENPFDYTILVDPNNGTAREFGIVYELPDYLQEIYKSFGFDLHIENGSDKMELPLAATYIIKTDRSIAYSFLEEDYTKRAEPKDILSRLKELS